MATDRMTELLEMMVNRKASDLHLSAGLPPILRLDGELEFLDSPALNQQSALELIDSVMAERQREQYHRDLETDFSFAHPELNVRFRVNAFMQERGAAAAFRLIPNTVPTLESLGLPAICHDMASYSGGLVLVTGATGSGKSTTLAAMIDYINTTRSQHILTIEDPIEFIHQAKKCLINQRELARDTTSFSAALRSALREDPDIILIGEMRDLETIRLALTAAETGHLVFGTVHTNSAAQTINRLIDIFPGDEKSMIRTMLSTSLQAVIAQHLVKKTSGGRMAALEIMICNAAIRNLIREDKISQIYSVLQTGSSQGMQTLDQNLIQLLNAGSISLETAKQYVVDSSIIKKY